MSQRPKNIVIGADRYVATVLQVVEKDPDGSPRTFRLMREDESINIQGDEEFFVVFAREEMSKRKQ